LTRWLADLPPEWQIALNVDQLQTERAEQKARLDQMMALLADNNRELKELRKMLRRRESQLKRAERENRKLRRKLGLPDSDDDPEPEPPSSPKPAPVPPASGNGSPAATPFDKKKRPRSRGGRRPPPDHLTEDTERHAVCACGQCGGRVWRKNVETSRLYTVVQAAAPNNVLAHCNTHPLRKYRETLRVQPKLAAQGMGFIGELYDLEDKARDEGLTGARLRVFRQRKSRAVLDRYRRWLQDIQSLELPPSDPVGKVVRYTLSHWDGLTRFVGNPDLPLDNNVSEREFQRHAKLRHASLFAGSVRGAERWATLLGVVRTTQKCGIDVEAYLAWLFEHLDMGVWSRLR